MSGEVVWLENRLRDISQEAFRSRERLTDALCDMYDIKRQAELNKFGELPKDNDGTETSIMDCINSVINVLEQETVL